MGKMQERMMHRSYLDDAAGLVADEAPDAAPDAAPVVGADVVAGADVAGGAGAVGAGGAAAPAEVETA